MTELETALVGAAEQVYSPASVDLNKLLKPFERSDSRSYCFCAGCGAVIELGEKSTAAYLKLAKELDSTSSQVIAGHYVEILSCRNCGIKKVGVKILKIPKLKKL